MSDIQGLILMGEGFLKNILKLFLWRFKTFVLKLLDFLTTRNKLEGYPGGVA